MFRSSCRPEFQLLGEGKSLNAVLLTGNVLCRNSVVVAVTKTLETRIAGRATLRVRGLWYASNACFAGRHNILRYANGHMDRPDEFHRQESDLLTGEEIERESLRWSQTPTLAGFLTEVPEVVRSDDEDVRVP